MTTAHHHKITQITNKYNKNRGGGGNKSMTKKKSNE